MARVTPVLWPHKENADGHRPIWLRFADTHRTVYASLGVYVHPRFWNEGQRRVRKGHPHAAGINKLIQRRLAEAEDERLRLLAERELVTAEALQAAVKPERAAAGALCFLAYAEGYLEGVRERGNEGRFKREQTVLNKLRDFAGAPLPFDRLSAALLREYETHLLKGRSNKASTVQGNMKVLRTHFRRAMKEGLVPREADPFFAYTPPKAERAERHKLTAAELARLEALDLGGSGEAAPLAARVRDAFLFSLYTAGIRFADVARLRCGDIRVEPVSEGSAAAGIASVDGAPAEVWRLTYTMGKTGKRAVVKLIPQARRIAAAYLVRADGRMKGAKDHLFSMLEGADLSDPKAAWNALSRQNALANKYLGKLAERAEIGGRLSFHVARHSFADLARRRGWDVYAISKALAHSGLAVTERYLAGFDGELVDRKMDELFGEGGNA